MSTPSARQLLKDLLYRGGAAIIAVGSIVGIYTLKDRTSYLGFVPEDPLTLMLYLTLLFGAAGFLILLRQNL